MSRKADIFKCNKKNIIPTSREDILCNNISCIIQLSIGRLKGSQCFLWPIALPGHFDMSFEGDLYILNLKLDWCWDLFHFCSPLSVGLQCLPNLLRKSVLFLFTQSNEYWQFRLRHVLVSLSKITEIYFQLGSEIYSKFRGSSSKCRDPVAVLVSTPINYAASPVSVK